MRKLMKAVRMKFIYFTAERERSETEENETHF